MMPDILAGAKWRHKTTGQVITVTEVKFSNLTNVARVYWEGGNMAGLADFIFRTMYTPVAGEPE